MKAASTTLLNLLLILPMALTTFACKTAEKDEKRTYWITEASSRAEALIDVKISGDKLEVLNDVDSQIWEYSSKDAAVDGFCSFKIQKGSYTMINSASGLSLYRVDVPIPAEENKDFLNGRIIKTYEIGKTYTNAPDVEKPGATGDRLVSWPVMTLVSKGDSAGFAIGHDSSLYTSDIVKIKIGRACELQRSTR